MIQSRTTVSTEHQPGEHSHFPHFGGTAALRSGFLNGLPSVPVDDGLVGIFKYYPLVRGVFYGLFAFVGQFGGLEVGGTAQLRILFQNIGYTAF